MKKIKLTALGGSMVMVLLTVGAVLNPAFAADLLPKPIQDLFALLGVGGSGTGEFVSSRLQMILLLGLGAIVLVAVVFSALSAFKYISSQGDPGKIEEAGKAVQAIFLGIAVLFVAIVGIVLVFVFFGADIFTSAIYQTCITAANSKGCLACNGSPESGGAGGLVSNWDEVKYKSDPEEAADLAGDASPSVNQALCTTCEWAYFQATQRKISFDVLHSEVGNILDSCTE
jgi:hypothetical protein